MSTDERVVTDDEAKAIRSLARLARRWPPSLKLFSASATLLVVDAQWGPEPGVTKQQLEDGVLETIIGIPNDGGDPW